MASSLLMRISQLMSQEMHKWTAYELTGHDGVLNGTFRIDTPDNAHALEVEYFPLENCMLKPADESGQITVRQRNRALSSGAKGPCCEAFIDTIVRASDVHDGADSPRLEACLLLGNSFVYGTRLDASGVIDMEFKSPQVFVEKAAEMLRLTPAELADYFTHSNLPQDYKAAVRILLG